MVPYGRNSAKCDILIWIRTVGAINNHTDIPIVSLQNVQQNGVCVGNIGKLRKLMHVITIVYMYAAYAL